VPFVLYYNIYGRLNIIKDKQDNEDKRPFVQPPLPPPYPRPKKKKPEEKEGDNDKENGVIIIDI